jgi:hypothetical protein
VSAFKKYALIVLLTFCCFHAETVRAEPNYFNADAEEETAAPEAQIPAEDPAPPSRSFTVTSIGKCYAQLSREDRLDIQRNFIKPYQECQHRLALKLKKKAGEKTEEAKDKKDADAADKPAETTQGFYRVQKDPADKKPADKKSGEDK